MQTLKGVITDILKQELTSMHEKKKTKRCCSFRCNVVLKSAICTQRLKKKGGSHLLLLVMWKRKKKHKEGARTKQTIEKKKTRAITDGRFTKMGCLNLKNSHVRILDKPPNLS